MAEIIREATAADSSLVTPTMAKNINDISEESLIEILSNLPQKDLVLCREVCQKWRDVIDQHCHMKETICLEEDDKFLDRKVELRMTSCELTYFQKTTPSISLTHPQTIKTFIFCDRSYYEDPQKYSINDGNARGLLLQIAPFVEHLELAPIYLNNNILPGIYPFPKLRELHIGHREYTMLTNLEILFSHKFPLLDSLYLFLHYSTQTLMDEEYVNLFSFLANHRKTLKRLEIDIIYITRATDLCGLPDSTFEADLFKKVEVILSEGQLQLESLDLSLPSKYIPSWTPIIASQKKLINLTLGYTRGPAFQFPGISPGILSSVSTLKTVALRALSRVRCDGLGWILLDLSVFRDAANLTELWLGRSYGTPKNYVGIRRPNENEGPWITNLHKINSTSLTFLGINGLVCNSGELQIFIDNAPVLEILHLYEVIGPLNTEMHAESGVHGGIIKSFMEKESKKEIEIHFSLNNLYAAQNEKLNEVRKLYPCRYDDNKSFKRYF